MALPMIIEDKDKSWLFKVITQTQEPELKDFRGSLETLWR